MTEPGLIRRRPALPASPCAARHYGAGESAQPLVEVTVPAGGECNGVACWKATRRGFRLRNAGVAEGVRLVRLITGAEGSRVEVKARSLAGTSDLPVPLKVRLVRHDDMLRGGAGTGARGGGGAVGHRIRQAPSCVCIPTSRERRLPMLQTSIRIAATIALLAATAGAAGPPNGPVTRCPPDAVMSGTNCIDKFEASVWRVPDPTTTNRRLVRRIQTGTVTIAELTAGGATRLGTTSDDYAPCADSGQNCVNDIYAVSLPGVIPSAFITWFQAQQACTNAAKRLPTNAEWQAAVAGTPDPGPDDGTRDCNTASAFEVLATGSRPGCVSTRGAFDMVGNVWEWVADWMPRSTTCGEWNPGVSPTDDDQCLAGVATDGEPGALLRGGDFGVFDIGTTAGPLAIFGFVGPSAPQFNVAFGFRCAR